MTTRKYSPTQSQYSHRASYSKVNYSPEEQKGEDAHPQPTELLRGNVQANLVIGRETQCMPHMPLDTTTQKRNLSSLEKFLLRYPHYKYGGLRR